jgi:hypothetical protein
VDFNLAGKWLELFKGRTQQGKREHTANKTKKFVILVALYIDRVHASSLSLFCFVHIGAATKGTSLSP